MQENERIDLHIFLFIHVICCLICNALLYVFNYWPGWRRSLKVERNAWLKLQVA